jgi:hypothetical protein
MYDRTRTVAVVAACLLVAAGVATAHGNHLTVDPQVSSDGTVVVENFFLQNGGYLVLHADDGGEPGRVVGVERFDSGYHSAVRIRMDEQFWRESGDAVTVWATLHRSDGDGAFDPSEDEIFRSFGGVAGRAVTVEKAETGRSYVVAANPFGVRQETDGPNVTVRNVSLASDGYLALHATEQDYSPGRPVGHVQLSAGTHQNVTVRLNESFYRSLDERYDLWAVVHTSDENGEFDPETDRPVTAGNETVGSFFSLEKGGSAVDVTTPTPTADESAQTETTTESRVQTATAEPTANATAAETA